jgi:hypothetical protein
MRTLGSSVLVLTTLTLVSSSAAGAATAAAADGDERISYASQPDRLAVFLNDIAYARDTVQLPGGLDMRVTLPDSVLPDTVILREDGQRVPEYRLDRSAIPLALEWQSGAESGVREVTLDYLLGGVGWRPTYDMAIGADEDTTVGFDYIAQIVDGSLRLEDVDTRLVAGMVNLSGPIAPMAELSANQALVGYSDVASAPFPTMTGQVDIQHVYDIGAVSAEAGDTVFRQLVSDTLPARRVHLWNAPTDTQVTVIYKVENTSDQPFADGIVRAYQGEMFIGSDPIELTPVGSEGSVTVGHLQDVRVKRESTRSSIAQGRFDYRDDVKLTIENFTDETVHIEVVDYRPPEAELLQASMTPQEEPGNVMRWEIAVEPESEIVIDYHYLID